MSDGPTLALVLVALCVLSPVVLWVAFVIVLGVLRAISDVVDMLSGRLPPGG